MKHTQKKQIKIKNLILIFFTILLGFSSIYTLGGIVSIDTNLNNAVQKIREIIIEDVGGNRLFKFNSGQISTKIYINTTELSERTTANSLDQIDKALGVDSNGEIIFISTGTLGSGGGGGSVNFSGDNLGDHKATQNLQMSGYQIKRIQTDPHGIFILSDGNISIGNNRSIVGNSNYYVTIGGGFLNNIGYSYSATIGGGSGNIIGDNMNPGSFSFIGGGRKNKILSYSSVIGGGSDNEITSGVNATIGGGSNNNIKGVGATIGGGDNNTISGNFGFVGGGEFNDIYKNFGTIPGGKLGKINHEYSFLWNGQGGTGILYSQGIGSWTTKAPGGYYLFTTGTNQGVFIDQNGFIRATSLSGYGDTCIYANNSGTLIATGCLNNGDNLGNHIATKNINLDNNRISNSLSGSEGIKINDKGNVGIKKIPDTNDISLAISGNTDIDGNIKIQGNIKINSLANSGNKCLYIDNNGEVKRALADCNTGLIGDNLGNHQASENIRLNTNRLSNDGDPEGIKVSDEGDVLFSKNSDKTTGPGDKFIRIASKGAIRGGGINGSQRDSPGAGIYSVGFGYNSHIATESAYSSILGGLDNIFSYSPYSIIGGGQDNVMNSGSSRGFIGGGYSNYIRAQVGNSATHSAIAGGYDNSVFAMASIIGGGSGNIVNDHSDYGAIVGGENNKIESNSSYGFIGGGRLNSINQEGVSTIVGGQQNIIQGGFWSFIGGGVSNQITGGQKSTIGGGSSNKINSSAGAFIGGGRANEMTGNYSTIGGGENNHILTGKGNTIAGGQNSSINSENSTIGGGASNYITNNYFGTIAGGANNHNYGNYGTIGGGDNNEILGGGVYGTIPGGHQNNITESSWATIGGGVRNYIKKASRATIGGGSGNQITGSTSSIGSTIVGGVNNKIDNTYTSSYSFIGGGKNNNIISEYSNILGGENNIIENGGNHNTIAGGDSNQIYVSSNSFIGGGYENYINGNLSFAGGNMAKVSANNTFLRNGGTSVFTASVDNTFIINAPGGVGINTSSPKTQLEVNGILTLTPQYSGNLLGNSCSITGAIIFSNDDSLFLGCNGSSRKQISSP